MENGGIKPWSHYVVDMVAASVLIPDSALPRHSNFDVSRTSESLPVSSSIKPSSRTIMMNASLHHLHKSPLGCGEMECPLFDSGSTRSKNTMDCTFRFEDWYHANEDW